MSRDVAMPAVARFGSRVIAVLLGLALVVAACSEDTDPTGPPTTATPTDIWGTQVTVSGDELWVFGGLVAEAGTAPPVTSVVPPGWDPNRAVIAYNPDGQVARRHRLPPLEHNIAFGRVVGGAERYLLGTMCAGAGGCGTWVEPVLYRLDGPDAEAVRLDLPRAELSDGAGVGMLLPIGDTDGVAWALQLLTHTGAGYAGMADQHRLLGIELATGRAFDGELPAGIYGHQLVCAADGRVFAAEADVDDTGLLHQVRILVRSDSTPTAAWQPLVELPMEPRQVWTGALHCIGDLDELALALGSSPTEVHSFDVNTGEATGPASTVEAAFGPVLGAVGRAAVALGQDADQRWTWTHTRGEPWLRGPGPEVDAPTALVILDGSLYDTAEVRRTLAPSVPALRRVELPPGSR